MGTMNIHTLIEQHQLKDEKVIAFTGSGGKTTLMYQLSNALAEECRRSITTTTTRIFVPKPDESPCWMLLKDRYEECRRAWETRGSHDLRLTLGWDQDETGTKLTGIPLDVLSRISAWNGLDHLLIEADGSRRKSLKGYLPHEPVLPRGEYLTVVLLGMDILGEQLDDIHVHRPGVVRECLSAPPGDMAVKARHLETMLVHPDGYLAKAGAGRKILVLNRIENEEQHSAALELSGRVSCRGIPVVFRGPLWGYEEERYFALHAPPGENLTKH